MIKQGKQRIIWAKGCCVS